MAMFVTILVNERKKLLDIHTEKFRPGSFVLHQINSDNPRHAVGGCSF